MSARAMLNAVTDKLSVVKNDSKERSIAKSNITAKGIPIASALNTMIIGRVQSSSTNHYLQPKLSINQPGDEFEQEADIMAERVLKMNPQTESPTKQLKTVTPAVQRKCSKCKDEDDKLQRKEGQLGAPHINENFSSYLSNLRGLGNPLPAQEKSFFEPRFGYDFSKVRIHTDTAAAQSASSINALAYTTGNNIVFNSGQYAPQTNKGKKLLGHELTHVIQQRHGKAIQRAPATKAANWWDEKGVSQAASKKFWDDIQLFFPKDVRKFSGSGMDNVATIDTNDKNMVLIGKGYLDEADPMKRKAMLLPLIQKVDENRFKDARIDNEDLTDTKITYKLNGLSGTGKQTYLKSLADRTKYVKNDQVIAYINGGASERTEIARTANETLRDWKFDNNRLTDADLNDPKINTRLRGLSTTDKLKKETDIKDLSAKTGETTSKIQKFLHAQTQTSTPVPDKALVNSAGGFTMSFPNVDVIVLPDASGGSGNATTVKTNLPKSAFRMSVDPSGLITKFYKGTGKAKKLLTVPSKLVITIQTSYHDISKVDNSSAYGKGTTAQDLKWGGTTLRFHEGSHGKGYIDFIASHNFPSIALGSVRAEDFTTINAFMKAMNVDSCTNVDQVGTSQKAFLATPAGRASHIVGCK
jgi:hypothetical protein